MENKEQMSDQQISLPTEIYQALLEAAQDKGLSLVEWIADKLPEADQESPRPQPVDDLLGAINSLEEPHHQYQKTPFGEAVAAKLAKQGLRRS